MAQFPLLGFTLFVDFMPQRLDCLYCLGRIVSFLQVTEVSVCSGDLCLPCRIPDLVITRIARRAQIDRQEAVGNAGDPWGAPITAGGFDFRAMTR